MRAFFREDPLPRILSSYCEKITAERGFLRAVPKNSVYSELFVYKRPLGLGFEKKYVFVGRLVVIPSDAMDESGAVLFRELVKGLCEVRWKVFPKRKPYFATLKAVSELSKVLEGFSPSRDLSDALNSDKRLLEIIREINPADVVVTLSVSPIPSSPMSGLKSPLARALAAEYAKPAEVVWEPFISALLVRGPGYEKKVKRLLSALEMIGQHLISYTSEVKARLDVES